MGFMKPKVIAAIPPPPPPPAPPKADPVKVSKKVGKKRKGYSSTILTSPKGVKDEATTYQKTLLGS
tara:strand:+ start:609 stop:806 length:198 start_codon:yes stop_codon:yes gene_type:complete